MGCRNLQEKLENTTYLPNFRNLQLCTVSYEWFAKTGIDNSLRDIYLKDGKKLIVFIFYLTWKKQEILQMIPLTEICSATSNDLKGRQFNSIKSEKRRWGKFYLIQFSLSEKAGKKQEIFWMICTPIYAKTVSGIIHNMILSVNNFGNSHHTSVVGG